MATADLQALYTVHRCSGFLFGIGGQLSIVLNSGIPYPAIAMRIGGLTFLPAPQE